MGMTCSRLGIKTSTHHSGYLHLCGMSLSHPVTGSVLPHVICKAFLACMNSVSRKMSGKKTCKKKVLIWAKAGDTADSAQYLRP